MPDGQHQLSEEDNDSEDNDGVEGWSAAGNGPEQAVQDDAVQASGRHKGSIRRNMFEVQVIINDTQLCGDGVFCGLLRLQPRL